MLIELLYVVLIIALIGAILQCLPMPDPLRRVVVIAACLVVLVLLLRVVYFFGLPLAR